MRFNLVYGTFPVLIRCPRHKKRPPYRGRSIHQVPCLRTGLLAIITLTPKRADIGELKTNPNQLPVLCCLGQYGVPSTKFMANPKTTISDHVQIQPLSCAAWGIEVVLKIFDKPLPDPTVQAATPDCGFGRSEE